MKTNDQKLIKRKIVFSSLNLRGAKKIMSPNFFLENSFTPSCCPLSSCSKLSVSLSSEAAAAVASYSKLFPIFFFSLSRQKMEHHRLGLENNLS